MKHCADCKHCDWNFRGYHVCVRKSYYTDPYNGETRINIRTAPTIQEERSKLIFGCGKNGRYFEQKDTHSVLHGPDVISMILPSGESNE